jgi:hypothetical protein
LTRPSPALAADPAALGAPRLLHDGLAMPAPPPARADAPGRVALLSPDRVALISNPRSHRNKRTGITPPSGDLARLVATPRSPAELTAALTRFAEAGIDLLVIDGGDGTVRDVLTAAAHVFDALPPIAIVPSGKTNALAIDLGLPADWTVRDAILAAQAGHFARRAPLEISRAGEQHPFVRGFLFGAGAFVRATRLAQRTHRAGAFKGLAVGLSLSLAIGKTMFGRKSSIWRAGERMAIHGDDGFTANRDLYILCAATLETLPLGLKPFGRARSGLKLLAVDAPPKAMALHVPALLAGSESPRLARAGYHHGAPRRFELTLAGEFILDGEHYPGGALTVETGAPIAFAIP